MDEPCPRKQRCQEPHIEIIVRHLVNHAKRRAIPPMQFIQVPTCQPLDAFTIQAGMLYSGILPAVARRGKGIAGQSQFARPEYLGVAGQNLLDERRP